MQRERGTAAIVCFFGVGPFLTVTANGGLARFQCRRAEGAAVMAQHEGFADAAVASFVVPAADRARQRGA